MDVGELKNFQTVQKMNTIYKINSGNGAQLCVTCRTIIHAGEKSKHLLCPECQEKTIKLLKLTQDGNFLPEELQEEINNFLNDLEDE